MLMPNFIRDWYRNKYLRDRIISTSEKLREIRSIRSGVDSRLWPHDCEYLDAMINRLERRHSALLRKFKEV